jgi:glutamine synthetase
MSRVPEMFGCMVFNDKVMRDKLPNDVYKALKKSVERGNRLDIDIANAVANAMKDWAIEKGATHFTHWFQPMTGITAEKHDSFIEPTDDGGVIMQFSGKSLIRGEPDASSLPSGGLRATFEARGYTAWDPTSYAFIKEKTLCIPTAFCSYSGEVLDKKTPLLRSMDVIGKQAMRILKLFGKDVKRVLTTVGAEQEYFLIDKKLYEKRSDLKLCGRTLFGAKSPKGQELEDHYFGNIKTRVKSFMDDLDEELWKLGIAAKTEHNEVAPGQHELAPIYTTTNIGCDHNQLTMEIMKKVAERHDLACLLHEKPFEGVNGSGKHNNWSLSTDTGFNLFEPGNSPEDNMQFLIFLCAVLKAVDEYADLLRVSVASAGNDHRLGGNEAPPAIISIFLGDELTDILESIEKGTTYFKKSVGNIHVGAPVIPHIPRDTSDRNRTSPFAFTGNKFEFRMLGSSASISCTNIILNTVVAEELSLFATRLEKAEDFENEIHNIIADTYKNHKKIIYNGDGYSSEWTKKAEKRGLLNLRNTADALPLFKAQKNIDLFKKHNIYTKAEVESRCEVLTDNYIKVLTIESNTMLDMVKRDILPACVAYSNELAVAALNKKSLCSDISVEYETRLTAEISQLCECLYNNQLKLEKDLMDAKRITNLGECAKFFAQTVLETMNSVRQAADALETVVSSKHWPYPTYRQLMFDI